MYQVVCENADGGRYVLHDTRLEEYKILNAKCKLKLNTTGSLSFQLPITHPHYNVIKKLDSEISLYQDGEWLFTGRVLNDEKDFENTKNVNCEGELSYLLDSNQRAAEYHNISVGEYFNTLIEKHNTMVDARKRFVVGSVTVTDPNDELYRFSNYENTWDTINDKLISRLGGYIRSRRYNGKRHIDYIHSYLNTNNQCIRFADNLLSLKQYIKGEDIKTAIIPLGAKDEETEERLTIESVNEGLDYVFDEEAVELYGWIFDTITLDDVHTPAVLKTRGEAELAARKKLTVTLDLTAIDLHLLNVDIERIKIGDLIKVISKPHGIDRYMIVSELNIDLQSPANSNIILGDTVTTLTDNTKNSDTIIKDIENIKSDYATNTALSEVKNTISDVRSSITQTADEILLEVSSNYATKNDVNSINENFTTTIDLLSDQIEFKFNSSVSKTETLEGIVNGNQELLEEYIRFKGALIELGRVGNAFTAQLSNTELAFLQNNVKIAYISNNRLFITDVEIKNSLTIGSFHFEPRTNGNLRIIWR